MILRKNRNNGTFFLGCKRYPNCKSTQEIPESMKLEILGFHHFSDSNYRNNDIILKNPAIGNATKRTQNHGHHRNGRDQIKSWR